MILFVLLQRNRVASGSSWFHGVQIMLIVLMLIVIVASIKNVISPAALFEVTDQGIVSYYNGLDYNGTGFLIPWNRVTSLEYVPYKVFTGGGTTILWVIAVRLECTRGWSFPISVSCVGQSEDNVIFLDAQKGDPSGKSLLTKLQVFADAYAGSQYVKTFSG